MSYCPKCGGALQDGSQFCPSCGASVAPAEQQPNPNPNPNPKPEQTNYAPYGQQSAPSQSSYAPYGQQSNPNPMYNAQNGAVPPSGDFDPMDVQQNKAMAILAYFGILVLVPIFTAKESKYARFHANQGLVLLICEAGYGVLYSILTGILSAINLYFLSGLLSLVYIVFFVFAIIGIVNAANGKAAKLPIVGDFQILK